MWIPTIDEQFLVSLAPTVLLVEFFELVERERNTHLSEPAVRDEMEE
ncbi:hypothetical protein [Saliphagus infecundisoli]|uniref:Uncharacterized protein n=1 Tax=Saliphagus infecundisoli TaxID=1849069 RepID=A0ABD5QAM3_9EURY|nr:hypothetical protein [Saliphagus infecundisoli]